MRYLAAELPAVVGFRQYARFESIDPTINRERFYLRPSSRRSPAILPLFAPGDVSARTVTASPAPSPTDRANGQSLNGSSTDGYNGGMS
jgi:hypothetical protein